MGKTPLESLLADKAVMAELESLGTLPPTTLRLRVTPSAESLREAAHRLDRLSRMETMGEAARGGFELEAIVVAFGRPTLLVQDNVFATPELKEWRLRLEPFRSTLQRVLPSVGRIELKRLPQDIHIGTGWLVAEDIVVTNRHVAEFFSRGSGRTAVLSKDPFGQPVPAQIDFREEYARRDTSEYTIAEIAWIEEFDDRFPDLALLRLRHDGQLPLPIEFLADLPKADQATIAVVGYPAWDYRNDAATMRRLFGDIYGVKRLAPGFVTDPGQGFVFEHDCTTLGGNSGSVVLDAETGKAIGLHFAGEFKVRNLAVRTDKIMARLAEFNIQVAVPVTYRRLCDQLSDQPSASELEAPRNPESYAARAGFVRDFVPGVAAIEPGLTNLTDDLAALGRSGTDGELKYTHFSIWMSRSRRLALCTAVNIDGNSMRRYARSADRWYLDPRIDKDAQVGNELYQRNRLDRGHLVRRLDPVWGEKKIARQAMEDTFHYTNAAPQHEGLNQVIWNELEDYILDNADAHDLKISVFTGPVFSPRDRTYRDIELPEEFWKIVVMARQGADGRLVPHATAYLLSQTDLLGNIEFAFGAYRTWQVPIALIEERTQLDFAGLRPYDPLDAGTREGPAPKPQPIDGWCDIVMSRQAAAGVPVGTEPGALEQLRQMVQTGQRRFSLDYIAEFAEAPPTDLPSRIATVLPAVVGIEPVFASDPRFVRIRLPGLDPIKLRSNPFELVEPLRIALGALSVEPDLPTDFFPVAPLSEDLARESADFLGCWVGNSIAPPADPNWALSNTRITEAWAYSRAQGFPSQGEGIVIAQPDTGVTNHPELADAIDKQLWFDLLDGGEPIDPLEADGLLRNPGHGTETGSVVVSRESLVIIGAAPAARLVPIRCIESVVRITQSRVARAIEYATEQGCHVITMSLGGLWSYPLAVAVQRAIENNVIVLAAAGNCVGLVVWPARFDRCIAVGGSNVDYGTWKGSCHGEAVDISAPSQHVYRASCKQNGPGPYAIGPTEGTSFGVALTAGVAALWLAHHGRQKLIDSLAPGEKLQDRFIRLLELTAHVPPDWDKQEFGAGIVDAVSLLKAGMGSVVPSEVPAGLEVHARKSRGTPLDADQAGAARDLMRELVGDAEAIIDESLLQRHGLELIWLAFQKRRPVNRLETLAVPAASSLLKQALEKPENFAIARSLGLQ